MVAAKEKTLSFNIDPIVNRLNNKPAHPTAATTTPTVVNRISSYDFRARKFKKSPIGSSEKIHLIVAVVAHTKPRKYVGENSPRLRRLHWAPELSLYRAYFVPNGMDPFGTEFIGYVYVISNPTLSQPYVGSTMDWGTRKGSHKLKHLFADPKTKIEFHKVYGTPDTCGSGRGTKLSAITEALSTAERRMMKRIGLKSGRGLPNVIAPATAANAKKWQKLHKVRLSGRVASIFKGGAGAVALGLITLPYENYAVAGEAACRAAGKRNALCQTLQWYTSEGFNPANRGVTQFQLEVHGEFYDVDIVARKSGCKIIARRTVRDDEGVATGLAWDVPDDSSCPASRSLKCNCRQ